MTRGLDFLLDFILDKTFLNLLKKNLFFKTHVSLKFISISSNFIAETSMLPYHCISFLHHKLLLLLLKNCLLSFLHSKQTENELTLRS